MGGQTVPPQIQILAFRRVEPVQEYIHGAAARSYYLCPLKGKRGQLFCFFHDQHFHGLAGRHEFEAELIHQNRLNRFLVRGLHSPLSVLGRRESDSVIWGVAARGNL
jgi:hypothetical protein